MIQLMCDACAESERQPQRKHRHRPAHEASVWRKMAASMRACGARTPVLMAITMILVISSLSVSLIESVRVSAPRDL